MTQEQFTPLQGFIKDHWNTFEEVSKHINKDPVLFFEGEGLIIIKSQIDNTYYNDSFYIFKLNGNLYGSAIKEKRDNRKKYFDGIYLLDDSLLKSSTFLQAQQENYSTKYRDFGVKIEIECKSYIYHDEHKLLFTKSQKVDLLYSHQIVMNIIEDTITFKAPSSPSLTQAIQWQKMVNKVNERTEHFIAERRKK